MSLLVNNHKGIGRAYMVPFFTGFVGTSFTTATSTTLTPGSTPVAGELMVITCGGSQIRTLVPPSGWTLRTRVSAGGGTLGLMWKIATGSEPSNYVVSWNSTLSGGASWQQFLYADADSPFDNTVGASGGPVVSLVMPSITVPVPGIALTFFAKSETSNDWNTNNGWTRTLIAGQHCISRREFAVWDAGEICTWSGTSSTISADMTFIRGRYVR